jgi:hypothetical protein
MKRSPVAVFFALAAGTALARIGVREEGPPRAERPHLGPSASPPPAEFQMAARPPGQITSGE